MSLFTTFNVSASGLEVQRKRIEVTSENLANANSTRTPEGGPYKKKNVVVASVPLPFNQVLEGNLKASQVQEARVLGIIDSPGAPKMIYDPNHPDANENGYVGTPDINTTQELMDILNASKAYEANVTVFNAAKSMLLRTLDLGAV